MRNEAIRLYMGLEHECSYLPPRPARSAFVDPAMALDAGQYGELLKLGFRRSGEFVYRPACEGCHACIPARIPVADFSPNRSQRRCLRRNQDLQWTQVPALSRAHFGLYKKYLRARHADGGMDADNEQAFHRFLDAAWPGTEYWSVSCDGRNCAVAVVDTVPGALSAVYCFFDPELSDRSLGSYCILLQIQEARRRGLDYLYMGYWISGCRKMDYKARFRPMEQLRDNQWRAFSQR